MHPHGANAGCKITLIDMASVWLRLVDQAEKNSHLDLVYEMPTRGDLASVQYAASVFLRMANRSFACAAHGCAHRECADVIALYVIGTIALVIALVLVLITEI